MPGLWKSRLTLAAASISGLVSTTLAAPLLPRQAQLQALSQAEISAFKPFTFYASASYCEPEKLLSWTCGENCLQNPTFQPIAAGGDGGDVQFWFVGIDPTLQTIVVGHQGTDPTEVEALLADADIRLDNLDPVNFPGLENTKIRVHNGFAESHIETAADIRTALQTAVDQSGLTSVTIVGHSLGGALALLDGVSLPLHFPNLNFKTITYGMPRVGNRAFAEYVSQNVALDRVINQDDIVPILPGRFLGYTHPGGELHIQDDLSWLECPGFDNADERCSTGDVRNIFQGSVQEHSGPYDGVTMGC